MPGASRLPAGRDGRTIAPCRGYWLGRGGGTAAQGESRFGCRTIRRGGGTAAQGESRFGRRAIRRDGSRHLQDGNADGGQGGGELVSCLQEGGCHWSAPDCKQFLSSLRRGLRQAPAKDHDFQMRERRAQAFAEVAALGHSAGRNRTDANHGRGLPPIGETTFAASILAREHLDLAACRVQQSTQHLQGQLIRFIARRAGEDQNFREYDGGFAPVPRSHRPRGLAA